jgi:hypothetical protein
MRKWLLVITLMVVSFFPAGVLAQTNTHFSTVTVEIMPDYDQATVLVMYNFTLAEDVALPASLELRIPAQASVFAIAVLDSSGALINATYESKLSGDWAILTLESDSRTIRVEYYEPYIKNTRSYEFVWPGDYAVDSLSISFQKPFDATNLKLTPDMGVGVAAQDGLTYYNADIGAFKLGQEFSLKFEYQKTTDTLSNTVQTNQVTAPLDEAQGRNTLSMYLPWILGISGGLLVVGGLVFGLLALRKQQKKSARDSRKRHAVSDSEKDDLPGNVYCAQCGKRAQTGDVFCRTCGSRMRREGQS